MSNSNTADGAPTLSAEGEVGCGEQAVAMAGGA